MKCNGSAFYSILFVVLKRTRSCSHWLLGRFVANIFCRFDINFGRLFEREFWKMFHIFHSACMDSDSLFHAFGKVSFSNKIICSFRQTHTHTHWHICNVDGDDGGGGSGSGGNSTVWHMFHAARSLESLWNLIHTFLCILSLLVVFELCKNCTGHR